MLQTLDFVGLIMSYVVAGILMYIVTLVVSFQHEPQKLKLPLNSVCKNLRTQSDIINALLR
jgi:hypothetical protein